MPKARRNSRERARRLYVDTDVPIADIARVVGCSEGTIKVWVKEEDWPRRRPRSRASSEPAALPAGAAAPVGVAANETGSTTPVRGRAPSAAGSLTLHQRCCRLFDQFLSSLEDRMNADDPTSEKLSERDVRALGSFSRAIEKIKEIEPGPSPDARADSRHGAATDGRDDEDRLRRELVDRLLKLRERTRAENARGGAGGET